MLVTKVNWLSQFWLSKQIIVTFVIPNCCYSAVALSSHTEKAALINQRQTLNTTSGAQELRVAFSRTKYGEKEDRRPNGDVEIEGNSGSDGKGEWSEMVRACVKEDDGHVLRKALEFEVKGKRKRGRQRKT